jgi:hypothetical protein
VKGHQSAEVKWLGVVISTFLLTLILINGIGYLFDWKYVSVFAAVAEVDKYEVRSELLMQATDEVGVCTPEDAARVWAEGLKKRSAALQYVVMTKELKDKYAKQLEKSASNWVTGMSSPWVEGYEIIWTNTPAENYQVIELVIATATSTGPAGDYRAVLTLQHEGDFWRIKKITMDAGLYPYTGFEP